MKLFGISDSIASIAHEAAVCPTCGGAARVRGGSCVSCLLLTALDGDDSADGGKETFDAVLAEVEVPDSDWHIGNYLIREEIGRGGMGVIYRAQQRHSRRIVALKRVLSYHGDSLGTLERFRREAEAAASLDHPNILPIYEVGQADGLPFFTMKFATGGSLQQAAAALSAEPRECVRLLAKVTRAVAYAHAHGILHRDLKPGNILLDAHQEPLVSDFGLAKWTDTNSDLTRSLAVYGTPGFIAPEQAAGSTSSLTAAVDIYSLGAVLFDLLTGRPPFLGQHAIAVIHQAAEKPAPKLRSLAPKLDRDLETIVARCLERDPALRYPSADALAADMESWLEGRPIVARPVSPPAHVWRWTRRNRKLATSLAACLCISGAAIVGQWQLNRLQNAARNDRLAARTIAVLPLLNLDTAQPDAGLTKSISASLESGLSAHEPARVIAAADSPTSLAATGTAKEIVALAGQLRARAILTGTHRSVNGRSRIVIRLHDGSSGEMLLRKTFEGAPAEMIPGTLAAQFAPGVETLLRTTDWRTQRAGDPGLRNPAAREFLVSGRQLMFRGSTVPDLDRAIGCFEKALQIEPQSAIGHAYLASALSGRNHYEPNPEKLARAESAALAALRFDPDSPDGHRSLAGVLYQRGQLAEAQEQQLRAVETGGTEERVTRFIAMTSAILGQPVRALGWLGMAQRYATLPGGHDALAGSLWALLLDDERAESAFRRAAELRPEMPDPWVGLCELRLRRRDFEGAREILRSQRLYLAAGSDPDCDPALFEAVTELFARNTDAAEELFRAIAARADGRAARPQSFAAITHDTALARLLQMRGEHETARVMLERARSLEVEAGPAPRSAAEYYLRAAVESCLGNVDAALTNLTAAVHAGWLDVRALELDPRFDAMASDARFAEIVRNLHRTVADLRSQAQLTTLATGTP